MPSPTAVLNVFRAQTHDPRQLAHDILSDERLRKALAKQGITIKVQRNG
jgi:fructose-specific phosphotransferase system component IIB